MRRVRRTRGFLIPLAVLYLSKMTETHYLLLERSPCDLPTPSAKLQTDILGFAGISRVGFEFEVLVK
jgi:hypothetical protein